MKNTMSILRIIAFAILITFALVGCSSQSSNNEKEEKGSASPMDSQYPISIKHAFGETVIESKPERVVTISWGNQDIPLSLGVIPVGFSAANYGVQDDSGMLPWTAEKLEELGEENPNIFQDTDGLDYEAISDANPDVILAAYSGITQEEYELLSEIAPVVAYQTSPWVTSWREQVLYNSMGMGMKKEGEKLIADTEKLIAEKVEEHPEFMGKKAAFVSISPADLSKFYIYSPDDPRGEFLTELGMEYPENISNQIDEGSFYLEVSAENADILNDAEILVSYGDENTLQALQDDPILGKIPAIERGSVVIIGDNTPLAAAGTPTPLSIEYTIDEYVTLLSEAVSKLEENEK